jgi:hypothetical protein
LGELTTGRSGRGLRETQGAARRGTVRVVCGGAHRGGRCGRVLGRLTAPDVGLPAGGGQPAVAVAVAEMLHSQVGRRPGRHGSRRFPCRECGANWLEGLAALRTAYQDATRPDGGRVIVLPLPR